MALSDAPEVVLDGLRLHGPHDPWLHIERFVAPAGELSTLVAPPGVVTSALALAIAGRLAPAAGEITFDSDPSPARRRRLTCLIDVEDVSAPDDSLPVRAVLAEELSLRGQRASAKAVDDVLAAFDVAPAKRWEQWPADVRTASLIDIAARQEGPRVLIIAGPDRHGVPVGAQALWWQAAERAAARGHTVLVLLAHEGIS